MVIRYGSAFFIDTSFPEYHPLYVRKVQKTKNNSLEYTKLQEYKNNIEKLINKDQYISKKEYSDFVNSNKTLLILFS